jgi:hypothetical protein
MRNNELVDPQPLNSPHQTLQQAHTRGLSIYEQRLRKNAQFLKISHTGYDVLGNFPLITAVGEVPVEVIFGPIQA